MNADSSTLSNQSYGNGTYVATASSQSGAGNCGAAFDKTQNTGGGGWIPTTATYAGAGGALSAGGVSLTISGTTYTNGQWLRLQLPYAITMMYYSIQTPGTGSNTIYGRTPKIWIIAGSTWTLVDNRVNTTSNNTEFQVRSFTSSYVYYLIYVQAIMTDGNQTGSLCQIAEWRIIQSQ
jgi:hypothetical protein